MFSKGPSFLNFSWYLWSFEFLPAIGSPVILNDLVMAAKSTEKLNLSGLDFLDLVLQSYNSSYLNAFFFIFRQFVPAWLPSPFSIVAFGAMCITGFFFQSREVRFCSFFRLKTSDCFPVKTHVFKMSLTFCTYVGNHGALIFCL